MSLNLSEIRVEFNPLIRKQRNEANQKYLDARREGRTVTDLQGNRVASFREVADGFLIGRYELAPDEIAVRFFDETGDRRVVWNATDPAQIREAKKEFDKYVSKGWKPYAINRDGSMGKRIFAFDAEEQEIIFDEKGSIREKLKGFASKFREVKMMPRTYPG